MRAFTLVEILISTVILSIFMVGIYLILNTGETTYYTDTGLVIVQQQARLAMDKMIQELRKAKPNTVSTDGARMNFDTAAETGISYYRDTANNRLIREHLPDPNKTAGNYITGLTFCCYHDSPPECTTACAGSNLVEIELTTGSRFGKKDVAFSLKGQARMRNE